jgi:hypothetical protein
MGFNPGANLYVGSWGTRAENVEVPIIFRNPTGQPRNPTAQDTSYPIGKRAINPTENSEYSLTSLTSTAGIMSAVWTLLGEGDPLPITITGDDAVPIELINDNWNIVGQENNGIPVVQTNGDIPSATLSIEDRTSTTAFVVDSSTTPGERGTFSTIQSAIDAAPAGTTVFIKAGTYNEIIALKPEVNLAAYGNSSMTPVVNIIGKLTLIDAGGVTLSGLSLQSNNDYAISVSGANTCRLFLNECNLIADNFAALELTNTGSGSSIRLINCWGRTNTAATNYFVVTGTASLTFWNVNILDPTPQTIPSTFASSGQLLVKYSIIRFPIQTSGTGRISGTDSEFNTFETNSTPLIIEASAGGLGNYIRGCILLAGNTTALTVNAPATLNMMSCNVITTSATPASGDGTINQCGTSYISNNPIASSTTLTLARKAFDPGALWGNWSGVAPAAGYVGESISSFVRDTSAVSITTGTETDITTIVLTPGVWDVSAIVIFTGIDTSTRQTASIGTVSATIPNISYGNNTISSTFTSTTAEDVGLSIPSFRQLVPVAGGNITMYLIARASYSVGTGKAYGRISATRVC